MHTIPELWLVPVMLGRAVVEEDDCFSAVIRRGIESSMGHRTFLFEKCDLEVIYEATVRKNFPRNRKKP